MALYGHVLIVTITFATGSVAVVWVLGIQVDALMLVFGDVST